MGGGARMDTGHHLLYRDSRQTTHDGENPMAESKEAVALELLDRIAKAEGRRSNTQGWHEDAEGTPEDASKDWILKTYIECLRAAHGRTDWKL